MTRRSLRGTTLCLGLLTWIGPSLGFGDEPKDALVSAWKATCSQKTCAFEGNMTLTLKGKDFKGKAYEQRIRADVSGTWTADGRCLSKEDMEVSEDDPGASPSKSTSDVYFANEKMWVRSSGKEWGAFLKVIGGRIFLGTQSADPIRLLKLAMGQVGGVQGQEKLETLDKIECRVYRLEYDGKGTNSLLGNLERSVAHQNSVAGSLSYSDSQTKCTLAVWAGAKDGLIRQVRYEIHLVDSDTSTDVVQTVGISKHGEAKVEAPSGLSK